MPSARRTEKLLNQVPHAYSRRTPGPRIRYGLDEVGENEMRAFPARQISQDQTRWQWKFMTGALRRILVIEDDAEKATKIVGFLTTRGYEADLAVNGSEGLRLGESAQHAVITIDRMLPGMDGLAIIRRLREAGVATPALIISALGEVDDRVRGLRAGGDDYLVKPFAFVELLARLEALAQRDRGQGDDIARRRPRT